MKYYCIGNSVNLVNMNLRAYAPDDDVPRFGLLTVTQEKMQDGFIKSENLILCHNLDDAKKLRIGKMLTERKKITPSFFKGVIAQGYPLCDYPIYEIEVEDVIDITFKKISDYSIDELKKLNLTYCDVYFQATTPNHSYLPNIDIYPAQKTWLNPALIACHYFPLTKNQKQEPPISNHVSI